MNRSDSINEIAGALAKAQSQIEGAVKGNVNPAFRSKYADLGAVYDAIRGPLTANGIAVLQQLGTEEGRVACTTFLTHSSGQWLEFSPFVVPVTKQDAQGFGSAATYARRYSLMAAVGIAPIDDDANAAVGNALPEQKVPDTLFKKANEAAQRGMAAYEAFFIGLSDADKKAILPKHIALKTTAKNADLQEVA